MQIDHDALVMVADGRKIMMFRNKGDSEYPQLETQIVRQQDNPADRDQASDAPGRSSSPVGRHGTVAQTDFHELEEQRFAVEAANLLKTSALNHEFEKLIVIAPPNALGEIRKHYHKEVQSRIVGEIAKDLVNHPVPEIEQIIIAS